MFRRYRFASAALCVLAMALSCPLFATQSTKQLAPGVSLLQDINTDHGSELVVNSVTVDLHSTGVDVKAAIGKDVVYVDDPYKGRETISSLTERTGALVGINADFFPFTGDPLGVCVIDGELISEPDRHRATVAVLSKPGFQPSKGLHDSSGTAGAIFDNPTFSAQMTLTSGIGRQIDGINRDRETNQAVLYTGTWGTSTKTKYAGTEVVLTSDDLPIRVGKQIGLTVTEVRPNATNTAIPEHGVVISAGGPAASFLKENLKPGDKLTVKFDVKSANGTDWTLVQQAVSGGPWLLKNGKEFIDLEAESVGASFSTARHPRTAVGLTADGKMILVTVDGRQSISRGISLPDLSALMKRLGAVNAINLDGGGSTTMSYKGIIINSPSGGEQRPVADALLVFSKAPAAAEIPKLAITGLGAEIASGQGTQLSICCGDGATALPQDQLDSVVWGTANGGGFINQKGYLIPAKLRKESIKAYCGSQLVTFDVRVVSGPPAKLDVTAIPDKTNPLLANATVTLTDENSNPCSGKPVTLVVTGGKADVESGITTDKGTFTAIITWDAAATERNVKATSGDLSGTGSPTSAKPASEDKS